MTPDELARDILAKRASAMDMIAASVLKLHDPIFGIDPRPVRLVEEHTGTCYRFWFECQSDDGEWIPVGSKQ